MTFCVLGTILLCMPEGTLCILIPVQPWMGSSGLEMSTMEIQVQEPIANLVGHAILRYQSPSTFPKFYLCLKI